MKKKTSLAWIGPLLVMLAALLWSGDGLLRTTLYSLPASVVVFWEHVVGAIILLPLLLRWVPEFRKMRAREWFAICLVAFFSGAIGTILYTAALAKINYVQYSVVVLLQQLQPIWAISTAVILLREKVPKRFIFWALVALVAAYFVAFKDLRPVISWGNQTLVASVYALLAGLMWGSATAFSKYVLNRVSTLTATALRFWLTSFFALPIIFFMQASSSLFQITLPQIATLLLIASSTGLFALYIYYSGLKRTSAKVTTLCELVWPASAILIDYFFFHKTIALTQWGGIFLLLFAIYKVTSMERKAYEKR